ncbi:MAG TPA: histidine phosphatase family protein [Bradyrhizobium sp.]|nr:histidine phosphatase family protein [Bradyrhizobium sp.]
MRHGHHSLLGRVLCGRMPDVALDELGCQQMEAVAEILGSMFPSALQSSPQRRALQSAGILAARCGLPVEIVPAFDEIDMGEWTGAEFSHLASDKRWQRWNEKRGSAKPPGGESMLELQTRVVGHVEQLRAIGGSIVIVTHAEPIRAALMDYLALPLDEFHSVAIDPGSVSTILLEGSRGLVSRLNGEVIA